MQTIMDTTDRPRYAQQPPDAESYVWSLGTVTGHVMYVHANRTANGYLVDWMEDWGRCDDLAHAGLLRRVHHGRATYGHVSYYLV